MSTIDTDDWMKHRQVPCRTADHNELTAVTTESAFPDVSHVLYANEVGLHPDRRRHRMVLEDCQELASREANPSIAVHDW